MRDDFEDLHVEERLADTVQHDPIEDRELLRDGLDLLQREVGRRLEALEGADARLAFRIAAIGRLEIERPRQRGDDGRASDRKSTRLNSSHSQISYAVFCLKKKNKHAQTHGEMGIIRMQPERPAD